MKEILIFSKKKSLSLSEIKSQHISSRQMFILQNMKPVYFQVMAFIIRHSKRGGTGCVLKNDLTFGTC